PGPTYSDVTLPLFAPESQRVFYWGTREEEAHRRYDVVADGTVVPTPFVQIRDLVLGRARARRRGGRRRPRVRPIRRRLTTRFQPGRSSPRMARPGRRRSHDGLRRR